MRRILAVSLAAVALAGGLSACSKSSGGSDDTLSIMVGGLDKQIYLPFVLADKLGYYKDAGLNVKLSDEPAGVDAETAMLSGQVDASGGFYDHNIDLQAKGQSTEAVVSLLQAPGEVEVCRSDLKGTINSPADWSGRKLGITSPGSSTDFLTQYLATKNGLSTSDIHEVGVGAGPTFIAAFDHKSIDCGITSEPTATSLLTAGKAFVLVDMRTPEGTKAALGGTYPASAVYMKSSFVTAHTSQVQKLVNAFVKTLKWIQQHSSAEITEKVPADYYTGVGKDAYVKALDAEKTMFNPTGVMPADGPKTCLEVLQANPEVKGKDIDLAKTFTNEFAQAAQST